MPDKEISIDDLIGAPFERSGRGPDTYDCWGLCIEVYRRLGIELPDEPTPTNQDARDQLLADNIHRFERCEAEPYCLALFNLGPSWHAGVLLPGKVQFIQTMQARDVSLARITDIPWKGWFRGYYRYVG